MSVAVDIEGILLMLVVVFVLARSASAVFNRYGIPGLIGEILIGVAIANIVIGEWSLMDFLSLGETADGDATYNQVILDTLAELGVVFLLFAVGLETRVKDLTAVGRTAMAVASLGVIIPFIIGYLFIIFYDGNIYHALFMGAAMVATSVGITARVIKDMKLTDTKESRIIIGAAVIDDILGMVILAVVAGTARSGGVDVIEVAAISVMAVIFVVSVLLFCSKGIPRVNDIIESRREKWRMKHPNEVPYSVNKFAIAIIVCLTLALLSQVIGLAAIIGAFLAGMLFAYHSFEWNMEQKVESLTVFLVPFFFVNVGLKVNISEFTTEILLAGVAIIILAIITKYIGCYAGTKIGDPSNDRTSANIIGIGMVPRGEVGIIVASIGLGLGADIFSGSLYSMVIFMSVATTLIAPPLLSRAFSKKYSKEYKVTADDMV